MVCAGLDRGKRGAWAFPDGAQVRLRRLCRRRRPPVRRHQTAPTPALAPGAGGFDGESRGRAPFSPRRARMDRIVSVGSRGGRRDQHMTRKAVTSRTSIASSGLRRRVDRAGAFTLLESLVATALIGVIVIAVISSVSTAQKLAFEGQKLILASMAADDLMLELVTLPYDELKLKNNLTQSPGSMASLDGQVYPGTFWAIGRTVSVQDETITEPALGVMIKGVRVTVTASDEFRSLATLETFVAEPAS